MSLSAPATRSELDAEAMREAASALAVAGTAAELLSELLLFGSVAPDLAELPGVRADGLTCPVEAAHALRGQVEAFIATVRPDLRRQLGIRLADAEARALHDRDKALKAAADRAASEPT
jgi:hypothetical protein